MGQSVLVVFVLEVPGHHPVFEGVTIFGELRLVLRVLSQAAFRLWQRTFFRGLNYDDGARVLCRLADRALVLRKKTAHRIQRRIEILSQVIKHPQIVDVLAFEFARRQNRRVLCAQIALLLFYLFFEALVVGHVSLFEFGELFLRIRVGVFEKLRGRPRVIQIRLGGGGFVGFACLSSVGRVFHAAGLCRRGIAQG